MDILLYVATQMYLEPIMINQVSQTEKLLYGIN